VSYTVLAFAAAAIVVVVDLLVLRTRLLIRPIFWTAEAIVLAFQLIVNGVLTGRGVVRYNPHDIIGARLVHAPIEDLFFGFALVTLTLSLWVWLGRRAAARAG
jgi:lycopene cyclase domain-containing protein